MTTQLAFIGAGKMAEAIARGVLSAGLYRPSQILAADVNATRRAYFESELKIITAESARDIAPARIVLLAVKPYQVAEVVSQMADRLNPDTLLVSIAAGITSETIELAAGVDRKARIVRVMPNTPLAVGRGMSAIAPGQHANAEDMQIARRIFESAGAVIEVDESQIHAVTAISGSGPAYFYFLVEQMIAAGVELGLDPADARQLAIQTARGAAEMMQGGESPEALRANVTTPNGTTHAAIETLRSRGVEASIVAALHAAASRSRELAAGK